MSTELKYDLNRISLSEFGEELSGMMKPASILDLYFQAKTHQPQKKAFVFSYPDYNHALNYDEVWTLAVKQALRLLESGIQANDKVGIWASTSWRWEIAQLAVLFCDAVVIGIDVNEPEKNYSKIEELTELKFILCEQDHLSIKWKTHNNSSVRFVPLFSEFEPSPQALESFQQSYLARSKDDDQSAFIFFTSGTTSAPKAIPYNHKAMLAAVQALMDLFPEVSQEPRTICWLPLANLFQRMANFSAVAARGEVYFLDNPSEIATALGVVHPTIFMSVPRFFEKVYESVLSKVSRLFFPLNQIMLFGFYLAGLRWRFRKSRIIDLLLATVLVPWDRLFFKKVRNRFGTRIKLLISGSAPIRLEILTFFHSFGLPVLEVYGVSENVIPIAANRLNEFKLGTVGKPVIAGSVKLAVDGEVFVKNQGLFSGYIQRSSEECFDEGFYKTGDVGRFDQDGFLFLLGRKNEMFKTGTGKKVAVVEIEALFKTLAFVDQVVVLGEGMKLPLVVLTLDLAQAAYFLGTNLESVFDVETGGLSKASAQKIKSALQAIARTADIPVKPGGALVLTRKFTLEADEITLNLKIKRKSIERRFASNLQDLATEAEQQREFAIRFIDGFGDESNGDMTAVRIQRSFELARVLGRLTVCGVALRAGLNARRSCQRTIAHLLRIGLGGLRGPLQRVKQKLSLFGESIPDEVREELHQLFPGNKPVNAHLIRSIVERELKKPISSLFSEWSDRPISTGHIGQVHWARLHNGREVAVKVLIPHVGEVLRKDLSLMRYIIPILARMWRFPSLPEHFAELKDLTVAEVNLKREASNFQIFKDVFRDIPDIIIPELHHDYCTEKVLVTDFIRGKSVTEFARNAGLENKKRIAMSFWLSSVLPVFRVGHCNADPQLGDFVIVDDTKLAVVSLGFCRHLEHSFLSIWKQQILACLREDRIGFKKCSQLLGIKNRARAEFDDELFELSRKVFYKPWLLDQEFHFDAKWRRSCLDEIMKCREMVFGLEIAKEFFAITQLYWSSLELMAELNVSLNVHRLTVRYLEDPVEKADLGKDSGKYNL